MRRMKKRADGVFTTYAVAHGNSLSITIPKEIRDEVNLKKGQKVYIVPKEQGVFEVHLQYIFDEFVKNKFKTKEVIIDPLSVKNEDALIVSEVDVESKEINDPKSFEV